MAFEEKMKKFAWTLLVSPERIFSVLAKKTELATHREEITEVVSLQVVLTRRDCGKSGWGKIMRAGNENKFKETQPNFMKSSTKTC